MFVANLGLANPSAYGISATPTIIELGALAAKNWFVALVVLLCFSAWGLAVIGATVLLASRCVFAWGLDRVAPGWFASVSRRWHSPYVALAVIFAVGVVAALIFAAGWITPLGTIWGYIVAQAATCISAMILPWRKRELWRASPEHARVGRVPRIFLFGLVGLAADLFQAYLSGTDSIAGVTPSAGILKFSFFFIIAGVGIVLYFVSYAIQKARGTNIGLNFAEIPPE